MTNQQENKINEEIDKIINKINKNIIIKSQVMQLYKKSHASHAGHASHVRHARCVKKVT